MSKDLFRAQRAVVARIAVTPADRAAETWADLAPDSPGYPDRLADYLRRIIKDPVVREALAVSSSSLSETLDRFEAGEATPVPKLERAAFATTRYLLRMCTRATPFGLFAGVAAGGFGAAAQAALGEDHRKWARVDTGWLAEAAEGMECRPEVRARLRLVANNLRRERGDRLELFYTQEKEHAAGFREAGSSSIRRTPAVAAAMRLARRPISYRDLEAALGRELPGAEPDAIAGLVDDLVRRRFLLSDLPPHPTDTEPADHFAAKLAGTPVAPVLDAAREAGEAYCRTPLGAGRPELRAMTEVLSAHHPTRYPPVQVELRYDGDFTLPPAVAREMERVAAAVYRIAPKPLPPNLNEYHGDYLERYGVEQAVPVLDLLDPATGLDAPAGYRIPASSRETRSDASSPFDAERAAALNELAWTAVRDRGELVLDEGAVDRLSGPQPVRVPDATELCFRLFAASLADLDEGRFTAAMSPIGGPTRPGAMAGRFMHMFDGGSGLADPAGRTRHGREVQLLCTPVTERNRNVATVPRLPLPSLPMGVFEDEPAAIDIEDLAVRADHHGFYLVRLSTGDVVRPVLPHMLNTRHQYPNVVQLLLDIEQSSAAPAARWWDWGRLDRLPYLPRVRYGRTVLSPARWRPGAALGRDEDRLDDRLSAWRERWDVPARVEAVLRDQRLELNLDSGLHRTMLQRELHRSPDLVLHESLTGEGAGLRWLDGRAAEFIVQLDAADPAPARPDRVAVAPPPSAIRYEPGTEWLYAKLYAVERSHDDVLCRSLPALLADLPSGVDRWFFIRYRDPEPHLRLRFHGDPEAVNGALLPALARWAAAARGSGLIRRFALDTYEPEVNRYGGPEALAAAERFFHADSEAVIGQLQRRAAGLRHLPPELLAAVNHVDILRSIGEWDWMRWAAETLPTAAEDRFERHLRDYVDPAGEWTRLFAEPGGRGLADCWTARAGAGAELGRFLLSGDLSGEEFDSILRSVLHMHANRMTGVHKPLEYRALDLVRERAHAFRARAAARA
ncbi:thiopeptide-type bacteriocin biosynthesis domain-containing protein [Glycomyces sambucus]|uniref:Thiopeptide-type bacteriocin biosynthesis domain-containing protein n=1 Tax=Glycomyces sambucus TaxID=380244 RepID=A0A1G9G2V9_9ACTN|nr:lantibiotic dehydratase [Glycomyces sambucus]SDK94907.1 thiopeptide-type bacteriocin biosynthesis domain-containing protein [Glycomyces sambucus]